MCLSLSLVTTFLPWVCPPSCYSLTVCCQPLCQLIAWLCSSIAANLMCHPLVASFAKLLSLHMQWYKKMSRSTNSFYAACCAYLWTAAACLRPTLLPTFLALLQSDLCSCSLLKLQQVIRSLSSGEGPNTIKTLQQVSPWAMACKKALTGSWSLYSTDTCTDCVHTRRQDPSQHCVVCSELVCNLRTTPSNKWPSDKSCSQLVLNRFWGVTWLCFVIFFQG